MDHSSDSSSGILTQHHNNNDDNLSLSDAEDYDPFNCDDYIMTNIVDHDDHHNVDWEERIAGRNILNILCERSWIGQGRRGRGIVCTNGLNERDDDDDEQEMDEAPASPSTPMDALANDVKEVDAADAAQETNEGPSTPTAMETNETTPTPQNESQDLRTPVQNINIHTPSNYCPRKSSSIHSELISHIVILIRPSPSLAVSIRLKHRGHQCVWVRRSANGGGCYGGGRRVGGSFRMRPGSWCDGLRRHRCDVLRRH